MPLWTNSCDPHGTIVAQAENMAIWRLGAGVSQSQPCGLMNIWCSTVQPSDLENRELPVFFWRLKELRTRKMELFEVFLVYCQSKMVGKHTNLWLQALPLLNGSTKLRNTG